MIKLAIDAMGGDFAPEQIVKGVNIAIKEHNDLDVTVEAFYLSRIVCENHNGNIVDGYIRHFYLDDKTDLKNVSSIFYPQVYAFSKNLDLTENDLYFKAEDQTAKFCYPLRLIEQGNGL